MRITTNNVPRQLIYGYELSETEKKEFDYLTDEELESHSFVRYLGEVYDPGEFMRYEEAGWDGCLGETFFSGILIKFVNDDEVIMGRFFSG